MEKIKLKYNYAKKALVKLKEVVLKLDEIEHKRSTHQNYQILRDSVIKRFEMSLDTFWKYLKVYLEVKKGIVINSPKMIFRECYKNSLMDEEETKLFLKMVDSRNMAAHGYHEEVAEEIASDIPGYYNLMKKLVDITKP